MRNSAASHLVDADRTATRVAQDLQSRPLTTNELGWVEFIRLCSDDRDPRPTLRDVQVLRRLLSG